MVWVKEVAQIRLQVAEKGTVDVGDDRLLLSEQITFPYGGNSLFHLPTL